MAPSRGLQAFIGRQNAPFICQRCQLRSFATTISLNSGHNRWSKIKHDKGKNDAAKNRQRSVFAQAIATASRLSGSDPTANPRLADLITKAKREGFADEVFCLPPPPSSSSAPSSHSHSHSHSHASPSPPKTNGASHSTTKPTPTTPKEMSDEQLRMAKESAAAALSAFSSSEGYDIVFECTGAESAIQMSIFVSLSSLFSLFLLFLSCLFIFGQSPCISDSSPLSPCHT